MVHWKYSSTSQPAHATSRITTIHVAPSWTKSSPSQLRISTTRIRSGMPVKMLREKYHQCGRRSSATVSPCWTRFFGYAMGRAYGRGRTGRATAAAGGSTEPELAEVVVVDAEVVAELVEHGHAHLLHEVVLVDRELT